MTAFHITGTFASYCMITLTTGDTPALSRQASPPFDWGAVAGADRPTSRVRLSVKLPDPALRILNQ